MLFACVYVCLCWRRAKRKYQFNSQKINKHFALKTSEAATFHCTVTFTLIIA